ncbi:MAG: tetratricopeptide repeat protein [Gemmatimonadota bacterium]|nr:tetratricopeptide repeat protein [Gemmatimonadota bacterium]
MDNKESTNWGRTAVRPYLYCLLVLAGGCADRTASQHFEAARAHDSRGDSGAALEELRAAAAVVPNDAFYQRQLGVACLRLGMFAEATAALERALELEPHYADVYRDLAAVFEAQEMKSAAIGWLERGTRQVPGYEPLYRDLVELQLAEDRPDEALRILEAAVERWPDALWAHFRLAQLYQQLKLFDRARSALETVLDIEPGIAEAHALLGNVFYEQEAYADAAKAYRRAIALNPEDHGSTNNLAWLYAIQGIRLKEAQRLSLRSLQQAPDSPTYLDTFAEILYRRAQYERAIEVIRHAISLAPEDPALRDHLQNQLDKFMAAYGGSVYRSGSKGAEEWRRLDHAYGPDFHGG